ncbi:putative GPI-anchored protein [Apostasia shenzhenica]|uniref:Putative GPI-anchored protein n=1 Tax=Apostasia shenzhenica TaxID=1088818 RepID=A0A2I0B3A9_9ASPA|nr:putative GPI-anchored protein [Apostasia shenzhenica]
MASPLCILLLGALVHLARSDDSTDQLLKGINSYRASLNLSTLTENDNADCLAEQIAKKFKGQPCTNTTGANTVPGTEQQFPDYPDLLSHCHLNATVTQDAAIMPACVPELNTDLVLSNYTKSQYSGSLNDSKFVGAGLAEEGDWVVVVLSTNTPAGSLSPATGVGSLHCVAFSYHLTVLLLTLLLLLLK